MSDRFKGRPKPPETDRFATLKAWVHWSLKNPVDEDQEAHAKATNDLFALLGTREAELTKLRGELERVKAERDRYREALALASKHLLYPDSLPKIETEIGNCVRKIHQALAREALVLVTREIVSGRQDSSQLRDDWLKETGRKP